ncbi:hypothetical protein [Aureimonas sp. Leaf460]|uniref:hypothetical protein n=1 Tax=Aureimonas sp. Leaf460 TaxID=1736384 RepID=UPI000AF686F1|nr:hypothetical protein [Aureimonas sp. Leaf460]
MANEQKDAANFKKLQSLVEATKTQSDELYAQWRHQSLMIQEPSEDEASENSSLSSSGKNEIIYLF